MKNKDDFDKKPENAHYWERMTKHSRGSFAIMPLISPLLIIAIALGAYYYIMTNSLFPEWIDTIYWAVKIVVGFEILAAAARTFWGPILALISGFALLYATKVYDISLATSADGWQLITVALVGFLVTIIVKL